MVKFCQLKLLFDILKAESALFVKLVKTFPDLESLLK